MQSQDMNNNSNKSGRYSSFSMLLLLAASHALIAPQSAAAFAPSSPLNRQQRFFVATKLQGSVASPEDEITQQLARAKQLLEKSKAKMEAKEQAEVDGSSSSNGETATKGGNVPFFAKQDDTAGKKDKVVKSTNEQGLITTDGEKMAELSESEEWETRSLFEVFRDDTGVKNDSLADRDVAASIFGLQRSMQTEDFMKIFDKRNRFIGEQ